MNSTQALASNTRATTIASLAFATVLTLAMLAGVNALATSTSVSPQLAQASSTHA